jgi:very-short-patch-repair endonuclease
LRKADHDYAKARRLRREMTLPERLLWRELRGKPDGIKFRRQHPVGRYVLDFYCASATLGIEVDGIVHDMGDQPQQDLQRDAVLREQGIDVVRIAARDVLHSPGQVAESIVVLCRSRGTIPLRQPPAATATSPSRGDGEG